MSPWDGSRCQDSIAFFLGSLSIILKVQTDETQLKINKKETPSSSSLSYFSPWQMSPPYPPCLLAMAMCSYSTSILHFYLISSNLWTGFLLLRIWSRNICKCIWRSSIFLLLYSMSASWISLVVIGSLAINRLLICHLGIILVQVCSRLKLYCIPEVSFNLWVLEYQHW